MIALGVSGSQAEDSKPKYVSTTLRISKHHDYFQKNKAPDFWALIPYYVHQQDGSACGIASTTILLNAARVHQILGPGAVAHAGAQQRLPQHAEHDETQGGRSVHLQHAAAPAATTTVAIATAGFNGGRIA